MWATRGGKRRCGRTPREGHESLSTHLRLPGRSSTAVAGIVSVGAVLAVQLLLFPIPFGVWLQGAVLGLLGSLMAVGLGLTYRLNKVINFAQGDLGTAPAVLAVGLIGFSGVNYFLGLATGLVASLLLTATVEILVVRRFRRSPRLILTVATIGLSQLLVVLSLLIPRIWGQAPIATAVASFPWQFAWHVGPVVLDANDLVAVIVSVACLAAVSLWFTRSDIGLAVQAVGDRRDRASMLGIPVGRLQSVTWVVAGVLSFVSVFFQATILGLPLDPTYGLTALVTALAALALGKSTELPVIAASGAATDPVAAHADAVTVAQQDHAFASIGGPAQTPACQDELARLHVLCMGCGDSSTNGEIQKNAPFQWANLPTADTSLYETVAYVVAKLNGKDAIWAGEPAFHARKRSFIVMSETSEPPAPGTAELTASLTKSLAAGKVSMTSPITLSYTL